MHTTILGITTIVVELCNIGKVNQKEILRGPLHGLNGSSLVVLLIYLARVEFNTAIT